MRSTGALQCNPAEKVSKPWRYIARAASAYNIAVDVGVLPEQILVREQGSEAVSHLAVARAAPGIFRLDQLAALKKVLVQIERGLDADAACRQLDAIDASPPRWPWWVRVLQRRFVRCRLRSQRRRLMGRGRRRHGSRHCHGSAARGDAGPAARGPCHFLAPS
jgi:hypothetical protein